MGRNDIYGGSTEGDEEGTVRYWGSAEVPAAALCVVGDGGNRVVWSGHRDGRIICWTPWLTVLMTTRERHMASLLVERSYIDLRSQVTQNGTCCNFFTSDDKYMLSDHVGAMVWTASYLSFALWIYSSLLITVAWTLINWRTPRWLLTMEQSQYLPSFWVHQVMMFASRCSWNRQSHPAFTAVASAKTSRE
ncbi:hypothetical protein ACS0TY_034598 [Phlomoides rotata]